MAQSLASIVVHLVFSTKHRLPFLTNPIRPELFSYLAGIAKGQSIPVYEIGGMPDHIHILLALPRTLSLSKVAETLKTSSTRWLKTKSAELTKFNWQQGYGAFSVSASNFDSARKYVREQERHHQGQSFQDELRAFLNQANVEFDEKYLWE